jgi:serine/threonine protein kinase
VTHDHVIDIYAVEDQGPVPWLVMRFIDGGTLQEKLDRSGPLSLKEILCIGLQTARGLAAAHRQGLIHRDVKPANILLENSGERVLITDFGLARGSTDAGLTQSGFIAGTPQYMSPEQADGLAVDHRSDLFSLGSVLYACCTGHAPFRTRSAVATLRRVCEGTPRPIREVNPEVPDWLCDIIGKLHARSPADRFQSAAEVAELLAAQLTRLQQPALAPDAPQDGGRPSARTVEWTRGPRLRSRRGKRLWIAGVALLGLLAVWGLAEAQVARAVLQLVSPNETLGRKQAPAGDTPATRPGFPPLKPAWLEQVAALPPDTQAEAVALE